MANHTIVLRNLCATAYANGWTLWHYNARGDSMDDVHVPGYFDDAADMIRKGDAIYVSCRNGLIHGAFVDGHIHKLHLWVMEKARF